MKVFITGGTGFVGSKVVKKLLTNGHDVILLQRRESNGRRLGETYKKLNVIYVDEMHQTVMDKINPDAIIHLATDYKKEDGDNMARWCMFESNVIWPQNLLAMAIKTGVKYFINTGTWFEYEQRETEKISEWWTIRPFNYYATTKVMFEQVLRYHAEASRINAITLKLFPVYGGQDNAGRLVPAMIQTLLEGNSMDFSPGEQRWNYTYVDDVADAYVAALGAVQGHSYRALNTGASETVSLKEIGMILQEVIGGNGTLKFGVKPYAPKEIMHVQSNDTMSSVFFGWTAKTPIREGLEKSVKEYKEWQRSVE